MKCINECIIVRTIQLVAWTESPELGEKSRTARVDDDVVVVVVAKARLGREEQERQQRGVLERAETLISI